MGGQTLGNVNEIVRRALLTTICIWSMIYGSAQLKLEIAMSPSELVVKLRTLDEHQLVHLELLVNRAVALKRCNQTEDEINRAVVQLSKTLRESQQTRLDASVQLAPQLRVSKRQQQFHACAGLVC